MPFDSPAHRLSIGFTSPLQASSAAASAALAVSTPPPGLDPPEGMPSHGSALHASGNCRPCGWFYKAAGCQNGKECQHCHLCPEGAAKLRKKVKEARIREDRAITQHEALRASRFGLDIRCTSETPSTSAASDGGEEAAALLVAASTSQPQAPARDESSIWQMEAEASFGQLETEEDGEAIESATDEEEEEHAFVDHSNPGSAAHGRGECQPCAWLWKPEGCTRGLGCPFCHVCPRGELRARKKAKHAQMRASRLARRAQFDGRLRAAFAVPLVL